MSTRDFRVGLAGRGLSTLRIFARRAFRLLGLSLSLLGLHAEENFGWVSLRALQDPRPAERKTYGDSWDESTVREINAIKMLPRPIQCIRGSILSLKDCAVPFACLHLSPWQPTELTSEEKRCVEDYFARGGFVLVVIEAYDMGDPEYAKRIKQWRVFGVFRARLSTQDADGVYQVKTSFLKNYFNPAVRNRALSDDVRAQLKDKLDRTPVLLRNQTPVSACLPVFWGGRRDTDLLAIQTPDGEKKFIKPHNFIACVYANVMLN